VFRDFMTQLVGTRGVEPPDGEVPLGVARVLAATAETTWRTLRLSGRPPLTRFAVWASALECTIDISRARDELGYAPVKQRDEGLAELRAQAA
jgi:nucleoside-diphosphate-sugar epimerase